MKAEQSDKAAILLSLKLVRVADSLVWLVLVFSSGTWFKLRIIKVETAAMPS
jgi:hypothetical protein